MGLSDDIFFIVTMINTAGAVIVRAHVSYTQQFLQDILSMI